MAENLMKVLSVFIQFAIQLFLSRMFNKFNPASSNPLFIAVLCCVGMVTGGKQFQRQEGNSQFHYP